MMLRNLPSSKVACLISAISLSLGTQFAVSAPNSSDHGAKANFRQGMQRVVVSYKMSPVTEDGLDEAAVEAACVAVSLAKTMQADGADVTLFTTLDGVAIANEEELKDNGLGAELCLTPGSDGPPPDNYPLDDTTMLREHILGFLNNGGSIVACGLCWITRYGDIDQPPPDFAEDQLIGYNEATGENDYDVIVGFTPDIQKLFRETDKILDF